MSITAAKGVLAMEKKTVRISSKRQITIPQSFFVKLGFADEAECFLRNGELVVKPAQIGAGGEFAEQILAELIKKGVSGNELLRQFKARQAQIRPAVEAMIADAKRAAAGEGEFYTYEDVFGTED